MRSLKTTGGLTRGSGMSDATRAVWLLANPINSTYSLTMEEIIDVIYTGSEQQKTAIKARMSRDKSDTTKIYDKLRIITPYNDYPTLHNIIDGITAPATVNVDKFYKIGHEIIKQMAGQDIFTYEFDRKAQAKNMATKVTLSEEDNIHCDPALLFQRLLLVSQSNPVNMDEIMSNELSAFPLLLFDTTVTLRKANKPKLCEEIKNQVSREIDILDLTTLDKPISVEIEPCHHFVLDGGSLIHRVKWDKDKTYGEKAESYSNFVERNYGKAKVVFDGYLSGPSTKDMTHSRRSKSNSKREVIFDRNTKFTMTKEEFLSNLSNKGNFIRILGDTLGEKGCTVVYSKDNAD